MSHHLKYRRLRYEENDREHEAFDDPGSDDGHDYLGPLGYAAWLVQERNELQRSKARSPLPERQDGLRAEPHRCTV